IGSILPMRPPGLAKAPSIQQPGTLRAAMARESATSYFLTFTWKPAALRAWTKAAASKSPVTVKVSDFGLAASLSTPSTFLIVSLIPLQQLPQQLWMPVRVRLLTLPLATPLSSFIARLLLLVVP